MHGRWVKEADNIGPEPGRPGAKEFLRQLARAKSMPDDVCDMQNLANAYYYKLLDEGGRGYPFFGERGNGGFSNRCVATPDKPNGNPSSCAFSYPGFPNTTTEASTCRLKIFGENAALELQWCMTNIIGTMKIAPPGGYEHHPPVDTICADHTDFDLLGSMLLGSRMNASGGTTDGSMPPEAPTYFDIETGKEQSGPHSTSFPPIKLANWNNVGAGLSVPGVPGYPDQHSPYESPGILFATLAELPIDGLCPPPTIITHCSGEGSPCPRQGQHCACAARGPCSCVSCPAGCVPLPAGRRDLLFAPSPACPSGCMVA